LLDAIDVALQARIRQDAARLDVDDLGKNVFLDLLVALEGHRVDDGVLDHGDDQRRAALGDGNVGEEAGVVEDLDGGIDVSGAIGLAGLDRDVRPDRLCFDALIAMYGDAGSHRSGGRISRNDRQGPAQYRRRHREAEHKNKATSEIHEWIHWVRAPCRHYIRLRSPQTDSPPAGPVSKGLQAFPLPASHPAREFREYAISLRDRHAPYPI